MGSPLQTPSTWEVRLSELLSLSVPVQWPEAVAVVRRVALQAGGSPLVRPVAGHSSRHDDEDDTLVWPPPAAELSALEYVDIAHGIPDPTGIWLNTDGTVRLEPAVATPGQVVARLRLLLKALLPASAPPDLELLADSATSSAARIDSGKEFLDKLTYFARPDDSQEIRALVARVLESRLSDERNRTLQALTERARHSVPVEELAAGHPRKALPVRRLVVLGVGLAGVLALTGGLWLWTRSSAAMPAGSPAASGGPPTAARLVQNKLAEAAALVTQTLTGRTEPPPVGRGADVRLPVLRRGRAERNDPVTPVAPPAASETTTSAAPFEFRGADGAPRERDLPAGSGVTDALVAPGHGVYSTAHPDVVPPTLIRAQMPQVPIRGVPITAPGVLEILVGDDGQVVTARLVPRSNRFQDRMMVSAAKTWRFAPARRYGQPVRYRLEMPITW